MEHRDDVQDGPERAGEAPGAANPADPGLRTVLAELEAEGWAGQLAPLEGGSIRCLTCRESFPASREHADEMRRLEGVSDPADMLIVVPLACPHCGTKGVLVAHYGPEAGVEESDVVAALARTPATGLGVEGGPGHTS